MRTALPPLALLLATSLSACSGGGSAEVDPGACTGKCDGLSDQPIIAQVARVWVDKGAAADDFFRVDTLQVEPMIADGISLRAMSLNIYTADNDVKGGLIDPKRGAQVIANLHTGNYPATIRLDLYANHGESDLIGAELSSNLRTAITVAGPTALPAAKAAVVTLPFSIWRVRIAARVDRLILEGDAYTVPLTGGWVLGETGKAIAVSPASIASLKRDELTTVTLVGPSQGSVQGRGYFLVGSDGRTPIPFSIDGPGDYVAEAGGLRRAKHGEIGGTTTQTGGADGGTTVDPAPAPDLASAWPSDCGGEGQSTCDGSSGVVGCAPAFVTDYNQYGDSRCHACGLEGEAQCADASGVRSCALGFISSYNDFGDARCHSCGNEGQHACADANGVRVCNAGLVVNYNRFGDLLCHAQ